MFSKGLFRGILLNHLYFAKLIVIQPVKLIKHLFSLRTESAAALEKTLGEGEEEEEGDVRDISNFFQHYISYDLLRILGGYQEHLCSILKELAM